VHWAPGIPRALFHKGERVWQISGAPRRENAKVCLHFAVIAKSHGSRERAPDDRLRDDAIQLSSRDAMDRFAGARNDDQPTPAQFA
jgi:hypothetical protein